MVCKPLVDEKGGSTLTVNGLGRVEVREVNDDMMGMVIATIDTPEGVYVIDKLAETTVGGTDYTLFSASSIVAGMPGQAEIQIEVLESVRDESDPDLPGYLCPRIETKHITNLTCGKRQGNYGCSAKRNKSTRLSDK